MTEIIQGNILDMENGLICHQVNCRRVAGAGLALQMREKWPEWYQNFTKAYLGVVTYFRVSSDLAIANLYAQEGYGHNRRYTNYAALGECLMVIADYKYNFGTDVYLPYGIGCGLAGGDWAIVEQIISDAIPDAKLVMLG